MPAVFADSGTFLQTLNPPGLNLPEGLALDAEGNLFVASHGSDSIFHLNPTGNLINKFSHPDLQAPAGLAFDFYMQELYVVSNSNNQVLVFHPDGSFARTFAQGTVLNSPWGIALRGGYLPPEWGACTLADKLQQVVIANSGTQQLLIYNPDGSLQDSLKSTQASPTGVALELFSQSTTIDGIEDFSPKNGNKISLKVYPNPFAKDVNISYDLPSNTNVRLDIFTLEGRQVRTLVNERLGAGFQTHTWDGTNESGKKLPVGFYQILLQTDRNSGTSRILLLR
ncbi:MAG: FlgD immunoglobulin-like domain containing protein [Bacteroidia bacterium]|nr:FlgD immunoglobulin-like domain containing protein [Bacteroidia bacterium]